MLKFTDKIRSGFKNIYDKVDESLELSKLFSSHSSATTNYKKGNITEKETLEGSYSEIQQSFQKNEGKINQQEEEKILEVMRDKFKKKQEKFLHKQNEAKIKFANLQSKKEKLFKSDISIDENLFTPIDDKTLQKDSSFSADSANLKNEEKSIVQENNKQKEEEEKTYRLEKKYKLPDINLLKPLDDRPTVSEKEISKKKKILQHTIDSFSIDAQVGYASIGPRVTLFKIKMARGVKVEDISSIANNLKMELAAESVRILAPVPGQSYVGIEVPNKKAKPIGLRKFFYSGNSDFADSAIPLVLGENISGEDIVFDLAGAPHLLVSGATGSGKSVSLNAMILSLLYKFTPEDMRLLLIDPKVVEFNVYNSLPHLIAPVVTEVKKVVSTLMWVVKEMEDRYKTLAAVGVRNLASFNTRKLPETPQFDDDGNKIPNKLPYIVVIIDELADIMLVDGKNVETLLARIAQLSRAVGIHTIVATQRPSVNVITGIIKANFPTRVAFQVTSVVDSRTILDSKGAEILLGQGDMLLKPPTASRLQRIQGAMVYDEELNKVVEHVC
ncbi:MAG: DNA translocase FtsK, partial [Verrucomicrobiota bacterium]|nr:DNA translocase FtsK [Verrucomicrobiota bacterium]